MTRAPRVATSLAVLAVSALGLGAQCQGDPQVTFEVDMPSSVAASAQWLEVGVMHGACPSPANLAGGLPDTGMVARVAFGKGNTSPPPVGTLEKGSYAFVAAARDASCAVVGVGCSQVDVTDARDVTITLSATANKLGACVGSTTCFDARCVPAMDDASSGASCPMSLVGAGPLGDPMIRPETVSAPAAVTTEAGFLVAYREYDSTGGTATVRAVAVTAGGALTVGAPSMLAAQCAGQDESDAVGLGYAMGSGTLVSARPACTTQPAGFDVYGVDATGTLGKTAFSSAPGGVKPVLTGAHGFVATGPASGFVAYVNKGIPTVGTIASQTLSGTPAAFGGVGSGTLAGVAAAGQTGALLAGGVPGGDAGATTALLSLTLGTPGATSPMPTTFAGTWGAVAVTGTRAFVVSDSTAAGQPLAWHAFDPAPAMPSTATFAPPGSGAVSGADVAVAGDLAFVVSEQSGGLGVNVFSHATTTPSPLRAVTLAGDPRLPSLAGVHDGKVAVAASASQVLVTWITGSMLGINDPVGGWALYACGP